MSYIYSYMCNIYYIVTESHYQSFNFCLIAIFILQKSFCSIWFSHRSLGYLLSGQWSPKQHIVWVLSQRVCLNQIKYWLVIISATALKGKVSWELGARDYHKVTPHNRLHTRDLLVKTRESGCLCSGEEQQRIEQEADYMLDSLGWGDPGWSGIGGTYGLILGNF